MKHPLKISTAFKLSLLGFAVLLASCGGSSSGGESTASISGSIVAAPVNGAQVSVVDANGNIVVPVVTTDADGKYSFSISVVSLAQDLVIKSSGGSFTDEATGNTGVAGSMSAYMPASSMSNGSSVSLTPGSTIIASLVMNHGKSMADAKTIFADAFGYTPDVSIKPADATVAAAGATDNAKLSGLRAAAFSQMAMDMGLSQNSQFEMFEALAQDLSDNVLDGVDASGAVVIGTTGVALDASVQNQFVNAMIAFHDSTHNMSGLQNNQIGLLPFAKVALSNNYKIEYLPGMMAAMEGKSKFKLRISDKSTGAAATGLTVTLMPMMHMAEHMHSSPDLDCSESAIAGEYDCIAYYLMPSVMAGGMSMGYWELKVMVGMNESVTFYPEVMMAMGDTVKATLKGIMGSDMISGMTGDMSRSYYVFKESLTGMVDTRTFTMFVAAKESMMSYPAVSVGTVLNSGTAYELTVASMSVEVSTDATNWGLATDNGNGNWSATPIAGLVDGTAGNIYVRVTVNGEQKTVDGMTPVGDGTNDYAVFTVTPGGM